MANKIELDLKNGEKSQMFYYPENFLNQVFIYKNTYIFFISQDYSLFAFKLEEKSIKKYVFSPKIQEGQKLEKNKKKEEINKFETINMNENDIKEISNTLAIIEQISDLKSKYEILCDILSKKLSVKLNAKWQRFNGKKIYEIKIDTLEFDIIYEKVLEEVDSVGQIRKKLKIKKDKISLQDGIQSLINYINCKNDKNEAKKYLDNDFKCPILFKNFADEIIPENSVILCEIKSGFALLDVLNQLKKRIDIIKYCLFKKNERPNYFIGIINLDSQKAKILEDFLEENPPDFEDNVLIIASVDYEYQGFDISYEIDKDFLLLKIFEETKDDLKKIMMDNFNKLCEKIDGLNKNKDNSNNAEVNYHLELRADNNNMDNSDN